MAHKSVTAKAKAKGLTTEVLPPSDWRSYADRIDAAWQRTTESIIETGKLLIEAKNSVPHGDWLELVGVLPFGARTAQMLMAIAANPVLSNTKHVSHLPPSWGTLHALAQLPERELLAHIEDHTVHPGMERKDVAALTGDRHPQTKLKRRSKADERAIEQSVKIKDIEAHVAELEAARREPDSFIDTDDEPTLARKIVMMIGKERTALLIVELQKLIRAEAA